MIPLGLGQKNKMLRFERKIDGPFSRSQFHFYDLQNSHFMTDEFHFMTEEFHFMTEPTRLLCLKIRRFHLAE